MTKATATKCGLPLLKLQNINKNQYKIEVMHKENPRIYQLHKGSLIFFLLSVTVLQKAKLSSKVAQSFPP